MQADSHSYVVRIWNDAADSSNATPSWRGSIDHVGTGKRHYFSDLQTMMRFIQESAGVDGGPSTLPPEDPKAENP